MSLISPTRRGLITGLAALVAMPAVVKAETIMPVHSGAPMRWRKFDYWTRSSVWSDLPWRMESHYELLSDADAKIFTPRPARGLSMIFSDGLGRCVQASHHHLFVMSKNGVEGYMFADDTSRGALISP